MENLIKVAGHPDLVRDKNGVIINTNTEAYQAFVEARDKKHQEAERIDKLEEKMDLIIRLLQEKQ